VSGYTLLQEFISVCETREVIGCGQAGGGPIPGREWMFLYMTTNNFKTFILPASAGILSSRLLWAWSCVLLKVRIRKLLLMMTES
jgi:hypothetical protein